ncbi:MAG: magnesium transporter CorA family protein [Candidatus Pacebacteria bacterium]|jgi:magnesium transporter|nr:magnesium transporter CorA family protein [Candidatus Paceibacterota bacterium]
MITYYFRTIKDTELKKLDAVRTGVWVHAESPTPEEIKKLQADFGLDEDIMEDAEDFFEVPRLEKSDGCTYFFTRYPYREIKEDSETAPLLIIMGESFVLTVALRPVPFLERFFNGKEAVVTTQKAKFFILMVEALTQTYDSELIKLRKAVQKERVRLTKIGMKGIERLVQYETRLNSMVDALVPTNAWLQQVPKGNYMQLFADDIDDMEDIIIANNQVVNQARSILKTIQNMRGGIEAIMTSRLNNSLSILTVLTILLTVPLVIASLYGMNVDLPFQDSPYVFLYILGTNVVVLGLLGWFFHKKGWF